MTRKDYQLIADAMQDLYLGRADWQRSLSQTANKLADFLAKDNPRFNREKFLTACGLNEANN